MLHYSMCGILSKSSIPQLFAVNAITLIGISAYTSTENIQHGGGDLTDEKYRDYGQALLPYYLSKSTVATADHFLIAKLHMESPMQPPLHPLPKIGSSCSDKRFVQRRSFMCDTRLVLIGYVSR
ncbi:hypothetical protein HZ326_19924 [Fusarium oxysporum f. sp. albedinis]|nr:hypothetical protein HZ326_19924 [Fusarium oxysporum f. sp. albedinis]